VAKPEKCEAVLLGIDRAESAEALKFQPDEVLMGLGPLPSHCPNPGS